jgi:hypothetical protein
MPPQLRLGESIGPQGDADLRQEVVSHPGKSNKPRQSVVPPTTMAELAVAPCFECWPNIYSLNYESNDWSDAQYIDPDNLSGFDSVDNTSDKSTSK